MKRLLPLLCVLACNNPNERIYPALGIQNNTGSEVVVFAYERPNQPYLYRVQLPPGARTCTLPDWSDDLMFVVGSDTVSMKPQESHYWSMSVTGSGLVLTREQMPGCP